MAYVDHITVDGVEYDIQDKEAVSFAQAQTLTAAQQAQAQENMGAASAADVSELKSQTNDLVGGSSGQMLCKATNADYDFVWSDVCAPTDSQVANAVNNWLDDHPEATTTVEDGSLTIAKFSDSLKLKTEKDYYTPQMFGGVGDGVNDDTEAIQAAISAAASNGGYVYLPKGTYLVTSTILLSDVCGFEMDTQAIIKAGAAMDYVVELKVRVSYLVQRPHVVNLYVDGDSKATNGVIVQSIVHTGTTCIDGLTTKNNLSKGVYFKGCEGGVFFNIRSYDNGGDGIYIDGCNNAKFFNLSSMSNEGNGVTCTSSGTSSGCYVYALHAEQNEGYGLNVAAGLISFYSGWLEGNKSTALYIASTGRCNVYGFRVVHADSEQWCEINSKFVALRDCEIQLGGSASFTPVINADYCILDNLFRAVQSSAETLGGIIPEKLLNNVIPNGDMQGDASAGAFNAYYCTRQYQNTDVVDAGKTYSMLLTSNEGEMAFRKDGVSGFWPGILYKITFRCYLDGDDCEFRVYASDQTLNKGVYSDFQPIKNGQWNEVTGYFYAQSSGEIRIGGSTNSNAKTNAGAKFYVSEIYTQPCVEKSKIATKRIGDNVIYETIEPTIM